MILLDIPGKEKEIQIETILLDYNGTIAKDGKIIEEIKPLLKELSKLVNLQVLTADTHGSAFNECEKIGINVKTFPINDAGKFKEDIGEQLGWDKIASIGNGFNDIVMCHKSILSVGVIESEGICARLILSCDILVTSIKDALDLFLHTKRIIATLRC